jgi:type IV secretory pathway TrbD component
MFELALAVIGGIAVLGIALWIALNAIAVWFFINAQNALMGRPPLFKRVTRRFRKR